MNKKSRFFAGVAGAVLLASAVKAQPVITTQPSPEAGTFFLKVISERGAMEILPIKGAPYSADQSTTTTQVLGDGNRIVQTSTAKVFRDEQGRTRIEHSLGNIGALASTQKHTTIMIDDAVANLRYTLEPEHRIAHKMPVPDTGLSAKLSAEKTASAKGPGNAAFTSSSSNGIKTIASYKIDSSADLKRDSEDLGTQTLEGLKVTGTRSTTTVPAGGEGNEQPMQIIDERWYSAELQTNVKTIHTDPRMGQTVFTLTNVVRANPDPSLFQIPSDYQITE